MHLCVVHMCAYMYAYLCVCMYAHILCLFVGTYMYVCMYAYVFVCVRICMRAYVHVCVYACIYVCICMCIHIVCMRKGVFMQPLVNIRCTTPPPPPPPPPHTIRCTGCVFLHAFKCVSPLFLAGRQWFLFVSSPSTPV